MHFSAPGPENTEATLKLVKEEIEKRGIEYVLVASTTGATGVKAARAFLGLKVKLVVVTHNAGFKEPGDREIEPELKAEIEKLDGTVYTGTMVLRSLGRAIKNSVGYSDNEIVAQVLRMFGQGIKVCVEIVAMAADAGLVPPVNVIAVAGTGRGADTACLISADSSNRFFGIKVREILAKPREF
ncbi:MAG: hypothetical protein NT009_11910 [Proteobacteria bacterium]|nr:hypothetical protein [Pseudomonadota bacterium]